MPSPYPTVAGCYTRKQYNQRASVPKLRITNYEIRIIIGVSPEILHFALKKPPDTYAVSHKDVSA